MGFQPKSDLSEKKYWQVISFKEIHLKNTCNRYYPLCFKIYVTCLFLGFQAGTVLGPGLWLDGDVEVELIVGGCVGGCVASKSSYPCRMLNN